ncbi:MAG: class I SAM-dependent methyltransferase [Sphingobium sp.]
MRPAPLAAITFIAAFSLSATAACANHHEEAPADAIAAAVASESRTPANVARDGFRHPAETLAFFGVKPTDTLVEYNPGGGWYTEILVPLVSKKGRYIGTQGAGAGLEGLKAKFSGENVGFAAWLPDASAIAPGSVDTLLTFRNVHNMVMRGTGAETFAIFFSLLKPGGTLGVVDHRLPEERDTALEKSSGYLKLSTVRKLAEDAGFVLEAQSEINANPKDSADWEKGVWTLPPTLTLKDQDRDKYLSVGESDRMTLRFRKPAT